MDIVIHDHQGNDHPFGQYCDVCWTENRLMEYGHNSTVRCPCPDERCTVDWCRHNPNGRHALMRLHLRGELTIQSVLNMDEPGMDQIARQEREAFETACSAFWSLERANRPCRNQVELWDLWLRDQAPRWAYPVGPEGGQPTGPRAGKS